MKIIRCKTVLEWFVRTQALASGDQVFSDDDPRPPERSLGFLVGDISLLMPFVLVKDHRWGSEYKKITWKSLGFDLQEVMQLIKTPAGRQRLAGMLSKTSEFVAQLRDMVKMLETGAFNE